MSEENKSLKRLDVVNYLNKLEPKVSPTKPDYKTKYVNYVCEHYGIQESEIPSDSEIYHDIYLIKTYYQNASYTVKQMVKKHSKFFDASAIKIKQPSSSKTSSIDVRFLKITKFISYFLH